MNASSEHFNSTYKYLLQWFPQAKALLAADGEEAKAAIVKELKQSSILLEEAFINCSKGKKFFGGDKIGYLDIALGCFLAWIRVIQEMANVTIIDESQSPNLFKWAQDFSTDDAVEDVLPETDKLMPVAKFIIAKSKASGNN